MRSSCPMSGCCPSDLTRIEDKYASWQTLHLLSFMHKPKPLNGRDHSQCTDTECVAFQIDQDNYPFRHIEEDCQCEFLGPPDEEIIAALNKDDECIPLLRLSGNTAEDLKVEVVESSSCTAYVALSYIWIDGLGNPKRNALYRCKLLQVQKLVLALHEKLSIMYGKSSDKEGNPILLIWLDTLCCPVAPAKARTKAIKKIRKVYSNADHVLVLDSGLQQYRVDGWDGYRVAMPNSIHPIELL